MSPLASLTADLTGATSLLDLATRLGTVCLDNDSGLAELAQHPDVKPFAEQLEYRVACIDRALWQRPQRAGGFADLVASDDLVALVERLMVHHPVEYLAFLRGLVARGCGTSTTGPKRGCASNEARRCRSRRDPSTTSSRTRRRITRPGSMAIRCKVSRTDRSSTSRLSAHAWSWTSAGAIVSMRSPGEPSCAYRVSPRCIRSLARTRSRSATSTRRGSSTWRRRDGSSTRFSPSCAWSQMPRSPCCPSSACRRPMPWSPRWRPTRRATRRSSSPAARTYARPILPGRGRSARTSRACISTVGCCRRTARSTPTCSR